MSTIKDDLEKLDDKQLSYVIERSRVVKDIDGYRNAGISRSAFYEWPQDVRDQLNDLARRMKREAALKVKMILEEGAEDAAKLLVEQVVGAGRKVSASVRQKAAIEVLDRVAGKPTQRSEISGPDGSSITVRWDATDENND
jgi:ACT domain-containing protein